MRRRRVRLRVLLQLCGWAIGRVKDAEDAQHRRPVVLQAMPETGRQMQTCTGGQCVLGTSDMRDASSVEDQHELVVRMAVVGRASWRDFADELSCCRAAAPRAEQDPELPVSGRLDIAVLQVGSEFRTWNRRRAGSMGGGVRLLWQHDNVEAQI